MVITVLSSSARVIGTHSSAMRPKCAIMPTPAGYAFAAMVFALWLGAMNYSNSMGFALAFLLTGIGLVGMHLTHANLLGVELRACAKGLPLDRLMVETDAPFLAPQGHRGRRNEPVWVAVVGETLAEVHDRPVEEIAARTTESTGPKISSR